MKIISLPVDRGGCGWYRVRQPFEMIKLHTEHDAHVIDKDNDDPLQVAEALSVADIIVIRQGGEQGLPLLRQTVKNYGKETGRNIDIHAKIVLDIDDNIELISPYSEHYKEYGTREYFDPGIKKWIWKDGEQGFNLARNRNKIMSLMKAMREVDLISVTTEHLAEYARQFNKNVAVLPNFIDTKKWWKLNKKESSQLRIGWSGGISHYEDWYAIKEPLNRLMRKYQFKLISVGAHFGGVIDEENKHLVEIFPWTPFEAHSYRMMCMELDAAIIPLADLPFNNYKSSIKFYEMSGMGVPSVVSAILPYSEDLSNENSSPYKGSEGFEYALEKMITNADYRQSIGNIAFKESREKWDAAKNIHLWINAFENILATN